MRYPDAMIQIALEIRAERVNQVQACDQPQRRELGASNWRMGDSLPIWAPGGPMRRVLAVFMVLGLLLAGIATTFMEGRLMVAVTK